MKRVRIDGYAWYTTAYNGWQAGDGGVWFRQQDDHTLVLYVWSETSTPQHTVHGREVTGTTTTVWYATAYRYPSPNPYCTAPTHRWCARVAREVALLPPLFTAQGSHPGSTRTMAAAAARANNTNVHQRRDTVVTHHTEAA